MSERATPKLFWCHRCTCSIGVTPQPNTTNNNVDAGDITCPRCHGGFVEEIRHARPRTNRILAIFTSISFFHRPARNNRLPDNPLIILPADDGETNTPFRIYYHDVTGLRPLPDSELFLATSVGRSLMEDFLDVDDRFSTEHVPASKSVVESMPIVEINETHLGSEECCPICKDAFEIGSRVIEMPCKHNFHDDCILAWLAIRNSCPVCRHKLPVDKDEEKVVGLCLWRLPSGRLAIGYYFGNRVVVEPEVQPPVVEDTDAGGNCDCCDGDNDSGSPPHWDAWVDTSRRRRGTNGGGNLKRVFAILSSIWRRIWPNSSSSRLDFDDSESGSIRSRSSSSSSNGDSSDHEVVYERDIVTMGRRLDLDVE